MYLLCQYELVAELFREAPDTPVSPGPTSSRPSRGGGHAVVRASKEAPPKITPQSRQHKKTVGSQVMSLHLKMFGSQVMPLHQKMIGSQIISLHQKMIGSQVLSLHEAHVDDTS